MMGSESLVVASGENQLTSHLRNAALAAVTMCWFFLAGCGGGDSAPPAPLTLSSIAVTPVNPSTPLGVTQQFKATGMYSDGHTEDLTTSAAWTSGTPSVAAVGAATGLATPVTVGSATITATSGSTSGITSLAVSAPTLKSVALKPSPFSTGVGVPRQLSVTGTYSDGTTADLTTTSTWSTSAPTVATVNAGLVTGVSLGTTTITAASGSLSVMSPAVVTGNTWTPAASMLNSRFVDTASLLLDGRVIVVGGNLPGPSNAEIYSPARDSWTTTPAMAARHSGHAATVLLSGKVLVEGGLPSSSSDIGSFSAEIYDPAAGTWSAAQNMAGIRVGHSSTRLPDGRVLVLAGLRPTAGGVNVPGPDAEIYNPANDTWTTAAAMPHAIPATGGATAILLPNGKVMAFASGSNNAAIYDPSTDTWSPAATMAGARSGYSATLLMNGRVLVAGGGVVTAEIYDPATDTWTAAASMAKAGGPLSVLLKAGKVMVFSNSDSSVAPQIYDPVGNVWSTVPGPANLPHTATLLNNGAVLVTSTASAELFWE